MRRFITVLAGVALVASASVARADDEARAAVSPVSRQVVVEGQAGGRIPLGRFGLAVDVEVARRLAVSAGVGMDAERSSGPDVTPRYAAMPRYRLAPWAGRASFSAGLGVSYGKRPPWGDAATAVEGEFSAECSFADGVRVRAFGGYGFVVDPHPDATSAERRGAYAGVALGYAVFPNPAVPPADSLSLGAWYGWQSLALDALAGALFVGQDVGYSYSDPDLIFHRHLMRRAALGTFLVGGPIVHVAHHHYLRAAASLVLRVAGPSLGFYLGSKDTVSQDGDTLAFQGTVIGTVAAALVDDLALGWERYPFLRF